MGSPITWRTVAGPSPAQALDPLLASQRTFGSAFDAFNRVLAQREAFAADQAAGVREGNKQAFLDALQQAVTPEAVEALKASGQLEALKSRLTPENLAAVRGAEDARLAATRQQVLADQQYGDAQTLRGQRGLEDSLSSALAKGDLATYDQLRQANPNMLNGAKFDQARATAEQNLVKQFRENIDYGQRLVERERNNEIAELNLKNLRQQTADTEEARRFETTLAQERARITADRDAATAAQMPLVDALKKAKGWNDLPVVAGKPDFNNWNSEQRAAFDTLAEKHGIPTSTSSITGDTVRANDLMKRLTSSGEFSPRLLAANEGAVRSLYAVTDTAPVGKDAITQALAAAREQAGIEGVDRNNAWYAPGSEDARNSYSKLAPAIEAMVTRRGGDWFTNKRDQTEEIQKVVGEMAATGVKVKIRDEDTGKIEEVSVVPAVNDVVRFLESSGTGWFSDDAFAQNFRQNMKEWLNSEAGQSAVKQGLGSQKYRDRQRVQQIFRESLSPSKK